MKTYLIKKEFKSVWKWGVLAMIIHFFLFIYGETFGGRHSFVEVPHLMLSGKLANAQSPLMGWGSYFTYFLINSIVLSIVLAFVQIYPEIQNKTLQFLLHRPVTKKEILDAKIITGLATLVVGIGAPFGFVVLTCMISGNYAAPFEIGMVFKWVICIYFACCVYLAIFNCCLKEGRYWKWVPLFSMPVFYGLIYLASFYFSPWLLITTLFLIITLWYLAVQDSFYERDFS